MRASPVLQAYAHDALLALAVGEDPRAPGGAITMTLCGHWDHEPPCPLAPHNVSVIPSGDDVRLRILFVAEPDIVDDVRRRIDLALSRGELVGPDGVTSHWRLLSSSPGIVAADEADLTARLSSS